MEKEFISILEKYWTGFLSIIPGLTLALIFLLISILIGRKISNLISKRLKVRLKDELLSSFIARIVKWLIIMLGFLIGMQILGLATLAGSLIAGAGVTAIVIGFALKDIGENFLSGVILAFNRPFNIGDVIVCDNITGKIVSMDLRSTTLKTFEGFIVFIPNSKILNNPLINYNREGLWRFDFTVGIDYTNDVIKARKAILSNIYSVSEVLKEPGPFVIVNELASSSVNLRIFYWINTDIATRVILEIQSEVIETVMNSFKEFDVTIPFDSIQVQFKKEIPEIPVLVKNVKEN